MTTKLQTKYKEKEIILEEKLTKERDLEIQHIMEKLQKEMRKEQDQYEKTLRYQHHEKEKVKTILIKD